MSKPAEPERCAPHWEIIQRAEWLLACPETPGVHWPEKQNLAHNALQLIEENKTLRRETIVSVEALRAMLEFVDTLGMRVGADRENIGRARVHLDAWATALAKPRRAVPERADEVPIFRWSCEAQRAESLRGEK